MWGSRESKTDSDSSHVCYFDSQRKELKGPKAHTKCLLTGNFYCSSPPIGGFPPISRGFWPPPEIRTNQWSKWTNMYGGRQFQSRKFSDRTIPGSSNTLDRLYNPNSVIVKSVRNNERSLTWFAHRCNWINKPNLLPIKRQWTYGPALLSWSICLHIALKAIHGVWVEKSLGLINFKFRRMQLFSCICHTLKANAS